MWDVNRASDRGDWLDAAEAAVGTTDLDKRVSAVAVIKDRLPDVERRAVEEARARGANLSARLGSDRLAGVRASDDPYSAVATSMRS